MTLPPCPARFVAKKAAILAQLEQPDDQYADASPKGAVDEGVRPLLALINSMDGFVTTSSCAGRVAVFVEGRRGAGTSETPAPAPASTTTIASSGGKGGGGAWLFVSHDPLLKAEAGPGSSGSYAETDWAAVFGLDASGEAAESEDGGADGQEGDQRLVHFKFEPMILHVLTASLSHAQLLLRCALAAGFRESGAVSVEPSDGGGEHPDGATPMVAVRSMGLGLASVVGIGTADGESGEHATCIVSRPYLARLARVADERFAVNRRRTERFREALAAAVEEAAGLTKKTRITGTAKAGWEDAAVRKARLRAEGLQRQAALAQQSQAKGPAPGEAEAEEAGSLSLSLSPA